MESEAGSMTAGFASLICLAAALAWPWIALGRGHGYQPGRAALLALAASLLFGLYHLTLPRRYNVRVDLVMCPPVFLVAWVQCLVLAVVQARPGTRPPADPPAV